MHDGTYNVTDLLDAHREAEAAIASERLGPKHEEECLRRGEALKPAHAIIWRNNSHRSSDLMEARRAKLCHEASIGAVAALRHQCVHD